MFVLFGVTMFGCVALIVLIFDSVLCRGNHWMRVLFAGCCVGSVCCLVTSVMCFVWIYVAVLVVFCGL